MSSCLKHERKVNRKKLKIYNALINNLLQRTQNPIWETDYLNYICSGVVKNTSTGVQYRHKINFLFSWLYDLLLKSKWFLCSIFFMGILLCALKVSYVALGYTSWCKKSQSVSMNVCQYKHNYLFHTNKSSSIILRTILLQNKGYVVQLLSKTNTIQFLTIQAETKVGKWGIF